MEERLKKMCECALNEKGLTASNLSKYGITRYYITKYINEGIIERVSYGNYKLVNESMLNEYKTLKESDNLYKLANSSKPLETNIPLDVNAQLDVNVPLEVVKILNSLISEKNNEEKINHFKSKEKITNYLKKIKKEEYFYVISSCIEISDLQGDLSYNYVIKILIGLNNGTYKFDIDYFAREFYKAGQLGNEKVARIYYNIIKNSAMFTKAYKIADGMEDALAYYEKTALDRRASIRNNESLEYELKINNFGIPNSNEIIELINNGVSIEDVTRKFNLSNETILYLYLLIAEYYYSYEMYVKGDAFIIKVLNNNKDNNINIAIKEVLANRLLYSKIEPSTTLKRVK